MTDAPLIRLLARFVQIKQPGDSIIERVPQAFRRCFRQLVDGLSLNNLLLKPYSMRRGGATSLFRGTNSLDVVVLKGRWATQRTARIYVNTSLLDIAAHSITSEAEDKMSQACNLLQQEMAKISRSSQTWLLSLSRRIAAAASHRRHDERSSDIRNHQSARHQR